MSSQGTQRKERGMVETITAVDTPLRFFTLALLIVESIIGILSVQLTQDAPRLIMGYLGTFMFVLVVLMVVWLVFKSPESLLAKRASDLRDRAKQLSEHTRVVRDKEEVLDFAFKNTVSILTKEPEPLPTLVRAKPPPRR